EVSLAYDGLRQGRPRFRVERVLGEHRQSAEITLTSSDGMTPLASHLPGWEAFGLDLALEVLDATEEQVRLRIESVVVPRYEGRWEAAGMGVADLLDLDDSQRPLLHWLTRQGGATLDEVRAFTSQDADDAHAMLDDLVHRGMVRRVQVGDELQYRVRL